MALFYYERALNSSSEATEKIYYKLGHFYERGLGMNKPNPQKGFSFFKQGSDLGDFDCCARLGQFYEIGQHIDRDINEAGRLYRLGAD